MSPKVKKWLHVASFILVTIGALNLGIYGIVPADANGVGYDLIQQVLGFNADVLNAFYILIGAAGMYLLVTHVKECRTCEPKGVKAA